MSDSSRISKASPFKRRRDDEIENASVKSFDSPKKARLVDAKPLTPNIGNRRYSTVSQPFRPPSSLKNTGNTSDPAVFSSPKTPVPSSVRSEPKKISSKNSQSSSSKLHPKTYHTPAVSKPFKSPFMSPLSSLSSVTNKPTSSPNIQTLEKKVTMLRRAIKLVTDKEDEKLKDLVQKWTLAGREVSWDLWTIMKERGPGDAMAWADSSRFNDSWSWGTTRNWGTEERTESADEENSARSPFEAEMWNSINIQNTMKRQEAEDNKVSPHTLGAMLRSYGITNDILGWNDDEEDFDQLE
ncbi:hypothetical protein Clacol_001938 [Clathrus columnatus]|uniref:Swi5-dependent recombination DNA repair protein 1 n=1 Tax=Clathrus columnatus TaxID=1419009 RepID=A0AAV5A3E7_9AGAM|nr:hypothetical protein Clacol_001938 [Clathrus columnatus]